MARKAISNYEAAILVLGVVMLMIALFVPQLFPYR